MSAKVQSGARQQRGVSSRAERLAAARDRHNDHARLLGLTVTDAHVRSMQPAGALSFNYASCFGVLAEDKGVPRDAQKMDRILNGSSLFVCCYLGFRSS
jgi:hypothetical protein